MKRSAKQNGFTLIELMVVIAISAILGVVAIVGFSDYNKGQVIKSSASEVTTILEMARSRAQSQVKPSICASDLNGYRVVIEEPNKYSLYVSCSGSTNIESDQKIGEDRILPSNLEFYANSSFFFPTQKGGVNSPDNIVICEKKDNMADTIFVDSLGNTKIQRTLCNYSAPTPIPTITIVPTSTPTAATPTPTIDPVVTPPSMTNPCSPEQDCGITSADGTTCEAIWPPGDYNLSTCKHCNGYNTYSVTYPAQDSVGPNTCTGFCMECSNNGCIAQSNTEDRFDDCNTTKSCNSPTLNSASGKSCDEMCRSDVSISGFCNGAGACEAPIPCNCTNVGTALIYPGSYDDWAAYWNASAAITNGYWYLDGYGESHYSEACSTSQVSCSTTMNAQTLSCAYSPSYSTPLYPTSWTYCTCTKQ